VDEDTCLLLFLRLCCDQLPADPTVVADICRSLDIPQGGVRLQSWRRQNLLFEAEEVAGEEEKRRRLIEMLRE